MALPLPITVKEARKLLGLSAKQLDDHQVTEIIDTLHLLAQYEVINLGSKK